MVDNAPLWVPTPDRIAKAPITAFMVEASAKAGTTFSSYAELHRWSVDRREDFWSLVWDFCGVVGEKGERVLVDGDRMPGASFFPDAQLNFAENLLQQARLRPTLSSSRARTRFCAASLGTVSMRWSRACSSSLSRSA